MKLTTWEKWWLLVVLMTMVIIFVVNFATEGHA